MSKQIDPAFRAHLAGETLTLAACWEIERVDGKRFFFTDHDRSLTVNGDSYKPSSGFSRSAVKVTGDLAAQGMSVVGIFDDADIKDEDLIKGLFDGAKVRMFLVNYADLSQGILRLKYGRFGEVERATRNAFQVELVDLTQKLNQTRGERRQPTCRARLGDARCNNVDPDLPPGERNPVPIVVPERQDATAYAEGDVIKVRTGADPTSWVAPLLSDPATRILPSDCSVTA